MKTQTPRFAHTIGALLALGIGAAGCAARIEAGPPPIPPPPELHISDESEEAQGEADPPPPPTVPPPTQIPIAPGAPPPPPAEASQTAPKPQPLAAPPAGASAPAPPPPSAARTPGPMSMEPAPVEPGPPSGQWVYTTQYGWIWLPYSREYTQVSADGGVAYEYAYYPNGGWRWVYAPWVLGWGPSPYWGRPGPRSYVWYSRPWFRVGVVHRGPVYHRRWHRR
jgi:hypothetical protein